MLEHISSLCITAVVLALIAAVAVGYDRIDNRRSDTIAAMVQAGADPMTAACAYDGGSYYLHGNCLAMK